MVKQSFDSLSRSIWMQDFKSTVNRLEHWGRNQLWNYTYFRHPIDEQLPITYWKYIFLEKINVLPSAFQSSNHDL